MARPWYHDPERIERMREQHQEINELTRWRYEVAYVLLDGTRCCIGAWPTLPRAQAVAEATKRRPDVTQHHLTVVITDRWLSGADAPNPTPDGHQAPLKERERGDPMSTLTQEDRDQLDVLVEECEERARREGWTGPWTLQVGDMDYIIGARGHISARGVPAKLSAAEGEYLGISGWSDAFVDWTE